MQTKVKILLIGPKECGKSSLANFLSDAGDVASYEYRPTKGCRIVEFEVPNVDVNGLSINAEVELWDVSGDKKYLSCWTAIQRGANGVVFVYNPGEDDHPTILESLYSQFVSQQRMKSEQCLVLCHNKPDSDGYAGKLSSSFSDIMQTGSDLSEEGSKALRQTFSSFLGQVLAYMSDVAERNEDSFLS